MARLRSPSLFTLSLLAGIAAVFATWAFVNDVTKKPWTSGSLPSADAQPAPNSPATQTNSLYPSDERGFINSSARCDGPLTAVAIVRTQGSLAAICTDQKANYQYRAVRLSDGAAIDVAAENMGAREFVARNENVTYSLTPQRLEIAAGDSLVRREGVVEYREPYSFPAELPPAGQTPASPTPTTPRPAG